MSGAGPVLVTGAAGFIGSALCERLAADGRDVVAYDNLSRGRREYLPGAVHFVEGDIRDAERLRRVIDGTRPGSVIHLAALHFIPYCIANPAETHEVNVEGTRLVLDACRGTSVRTVTFASSAAVYAPSDDPCVEDATPIGPLEVYGTSKVSGESLVQGFYEETGIPCTVLRLFNAIGRRETNPHVVPHIFESLRRSDTIPLGNTAPRRDYIDTHDIAAALVGATAAADGLRIFNVGTGRAHAVTDLIGVLQTILGRELRVQQEAARVRATDRMLLLADTSRIEAAIGWRARIPLETTLRDLLDEYGIR